MSVMSAGKRVFAAEILTTVCFQVQKKKWNVGIVQTYVGLIVTVRIKILVMAITGSNQMKEREGNKEIAETLSRIFLRKHLHFRGSEQIIENFEANLIEELDKKDNTPCPDCVEKDKVLKSVINNYEEIGARNRAELTKAKERVKELEEEVKSLKNRKPFDYLPRHDGD